MTLSKPISNWLNKISSNHWKILTCCHVKIKAIFVVLRQLDCWRRSRVLATTQDLGAGHFVVWINYYLRSCFVFILGQSQQGQTIFEDRAISGTVFVCGYLALQFDYSARFATQDLALQRSKGSCNRTGDY